MAGHSKWANIQHRRGALDRRRARLVAMTSRACAGGPYEPARYEGYGPGGAALLVDCLTDDRRRTGTEVRQTLARHGGTLGAEGSVGYLFNEVGLIAFAPGADAGRLASVALEAGAEDVIANPDASIEVLTDPRELDRVQGALAAAGFGVAPGEITFRGHAAVALAGDEAHEMVHLIDDLEDLDDVQHVYSNAAIPSEILARV
jgi:YebC/PmpR family DNA-binding regulatory protein